MDTSDLRHLPRPVQQAVRHLLATLGQAFPLAPAEAIPSGVPEPMSRFPRSATELAVLDALAGLAPMPASPAQVAALVRQPRVEVRIILQALATLGTIHHPGNGLYRSRQPGEDLQRPPPRGSREERRQWLLATGQRLAEDDRPSTRYAAQIAALCRPEAEQA